jgi:hypothetical protein
MIPVNTKNILFICGGAFDGIEKKIAQRLNTHVVGYSAVRNTATIDKSNMMQYIAPQDLKSFGLIPEIIGRLPVLTYLNPLDRAALRSILTEPKNSIIKQYIKLFEMDNVKLTFEDPVLMQRLIAEKMPLTVCPLSNLKLCVVDDMAQHNIRRLLQQGVQVTVNSDDPSYFGGYMNDNFIAITDALDLTAAELKQLALNSFEASFISAEEKQKWAAEIAAIA